MQAGTHGTDSQPGTQHMEAFSGHSFDWGYTICKAPGQAGLLRASPRACTGSTNKVPGTHVKAVGHAADIKACHVAPWKASPCDVITPRGQHGAHGAPLQTWHRCSCSQLPLYWLLQSSTLSRTQSCVPSSSHVGSCTELAAFCCCCACHVVYLSGNEGSAKCLKASHRGLCVELCQVSQHHQGLWLLHCPSARL